MKRFASFLNSEVYLRFGIAMFSIKENAVSIFLITHHCSMIQELEFNDNIHVWRIALNDLASSIERFEAVLSFDERIRANSFHFGRDRKQFVLSHGALRIILGKYLKLNTDEIEFTCNRFGKPKLIGCESLRFNLSHSGDTALVAVAANTEVGVDVEVLDRSIDLLGLAKRFFSESEYRKIAASSESNQLVLFYRCWTGKESVVKAIGGGLSISLDSFSISLSCYELQEICISREKRVSIWSLMTLDLNEPYFGSVAFEGREKCVVMMDWNESLFFGR